MRRFVAYGALFTILFVLLGCATVKQAHDNYQACLADPACVSKMERVHLLAEDTARPIISTVAPAPFANPIVESVGYLASLLTGVFVGRKTKR